MRDQGEATLTGSANSGVSIDIVNTFDFDELEELDKILRNNRNPKLPTSGISKNSQVTFIASVTHNITTNTHTITSKLANLHLRCTGTEPKTPTRKGR
jgi:hypothetical protein